MKSAILSLFSKETLIQVLAFFLHAITPAMWQAAKEKVEDAEAEVTRDGWPLDAGAKFDSVFQSLAKDFPALRTAALNWLIETAVSCALASLRK